MTILKAKITKISALILIMIATLLPTVGAWAKDVDILASNYGYGEYVVKAGGTGYGVYDEDLVKFYYYPVDGEVSENEDTGDYAVSLEYDADDGTGGDTGEVSRVLINILDQNGDPVGPSPIEVLAPVKTVNFNLDGYGMASGIYTVTATAYNKNGELLYKPIKIGEIEYEIIPVPDTGTFFQGLNISKEDYLITGLIIFFVVGICGIYLVTRSGKNVKKRR